MPWDENIGKKKNGNSSVNMQTGATTQETDTTNGTITDGEGDEVIQIDTEHVVNQVVTAAIGGVASAVATRWLLDDS